MFPFKDFFLPPSYPGWPFKSWPCLSLGEAEWLFESLARSLDWWNCPCTPSRISCHWVCQGVHWTKYHKYRLTPPPPPPPLPTLIWKSFTVSCQAELHATTALSQPNREEPCRIGVVFYQVRFDGTKKKFFKRLGFGRWTLRLVHVELELGLALIWIRSSPNKMGVVYRLLYKILSPTQSPAESGFATAL